MSEQHISLDPDEDLDAEPPKRKQTRRRFLKWLSLGTVVAVGGGGAYAWRIEPHWIDVVRRDLPIDGLPASLDGRSLAQISDLHVGRVVDSDYIRGAMDRVQALRPDMIAVTGDFMSCRADEQIAPAVDVVSMLTHPAPPLGIVASLGNHDYAHRWRNAEVAETFSRQLAERGVRVLRNEVTVVEGLQFAGMDDYWANRFDAAGTLAACDPALPSVVLSHNPDTADMEGWGDWRGWILAGHTHGGQVDLPLIGTPRLPVRNKRYVEGAIDLHEGRRLYINRGLGYLRRVRMGSRPEITLFTLRRA